MKYDDASWHYGGNFPEGLPESAGATHIAMFVAWAALNGLGGDVHKVDFSDELTSLQRQKITPGTWFLGVCDGKFTDEDLNVEGNIFASAYYGNSEGLHTAEGSYLADYDSTLAKKKSLFAKSRTLYHVPDTWETFWAISPVLEARYAGWRNGR